MSQIFTLVLSSDVAISDGGFVLDSTNNCNTRYLVNFDSLFQGENRRYSKCMLRSQLISQNVASSAINNATGLLTLQGLGSANSLGINGLFLGVMVPAGAGASGVSTGYYYNGSGTIPFPNGVQVTQIPTGIRDFYVVFTSIADTIQLNANLGNYKLVLQFELYDRIE